MKKKARPRRKPKSPSRPDKLGLPELLDLSILQQLLEGFSQTTGMSAVVRDQNGEPLNPPEPANAFCAEIHKSPLGCERCERSGRRAVQRAIREGQIVENTCHAGLNRFAAPIRVAGQCVGAIVIGEWVERPLSPQRLTRLARDLGLDRSRLCAGAKDIEQWSGEGKRRPALYLHSVANAIAGLAYQGFQVRERLSEISKLYDISCMLVSTLDLAHLLTLIAEHATDLLGVKGCSIRLLDSRKEELVIKSWYNLSRRYRKKGPVLVEKSLIDRAAMSGELVEMPDIAKDKRVLYSTEAAEEGFASGAAVGLISQGEPVGTLHVYSGEKRRLSEREKQILRSLAAIAAIAIHNAQLYRDSCELAEVDRELRVASEIQKQLLPRRPPSIPGYQLAAVAVPTRQVGGDFFDFIDLGADRWGLAIADVVGKGVPGAILMATARALLRAHARPDRRPAQVVAQTNKLVCQDVNPDQFVTAVYAVLDARVGTLTYCNAGHNTPLIFREGEIIELHKGGLVLGALEDEVYEEETVMMSPGDVAVFYTDGLTEAENKRRRLFGRERLERAALRHPHRSARYILRGIRDALRGFTLGVPQTDDFTAFVLKCGQ